MSLDKYLKPKSRTGAPERRPGSSPTPDAENLPGNDGERLRQKASRYSDYAGHPTTPIETESVPPMVKPIEPHTADPEPNTDQNLPVNSPRNNAKGKRFKSATKRKNPPISSSTGLKASRKSGLTNDLAPTTGIKLVFVDETMKADYMQIAGYLMLYHRVKLTMTAYFCFLHQQAIARQSDKQFMADLAQFITPTADHVTL